MSPVPILFTIPNFITAGSGRAMLNIVERLDRRRFSPAVAVLRKGGDLDRVVEDLGIPFIEAPFTLSAKPYATLLLRAWRAAQAFRPYRFALWHSFHYSDDYSEAIISRLAGARAWVYTKKNMGWRSRAWRVRTYLASRVAAQNSDMMKQFFANGYFRAKARLIPRGVVTSRFSPGVPPRLQVRSRHSITACSVVIACVAQLLPVKGHPTLLKAMVSVPEAHLLVAGRPMDEDYSNGLYRQVSELNLGRRVHFLGEVKDVPALLAESDVFVLPTWGKWRMEGCPVALLEAMSCGRACVGTDIPGSRDLIENGRSGVLVPPEDVEALAEGLQALALSPQRRQLLGQAARQRVLESYAIEREVAQHEALYQESLLKAV